MRKSLLAIAILSLVFAISCQQEKTNEDNTYIVLSGKVLNATSDSLALYKNGKVLPNAIKLAKDSTFSDTLHIKNGTYYIYDGSNAFEVYLKSGYNLSLDIDASNITETKFEGKGAGENNFLSEKNKLQKELAPLKNYNHFCNLAEQDFLSMNDSIHEIEIKLLDDNKTNLDKEFLFIQKESYKYEKLTRINQYNVYNTYYLEHDTPFSVSENYPNPFEKIAFDDKRLALVPAYISLLNEHVHSSRMTDTVEEGITLRTIARADTIIPNEDIKSAYFNHFAQSFLEETDDLDATYNILNEQISDKETAKTLEKSYKGLKKIEKGNISPSFNYKDISGNMVSLESLKGGVVYIDVWATWCGPCRGELPFLKTLEKEMNKENVHFVSICVWDKEPKWEKFVKDQDLHGIQLFAPREEMDFAEAYFIKGVPRFILLDKEGKIVDNDAKRPSNPKLKAEIKSLL